MHACLYAPLHGIFSFFCLGGGLGVVLVPYNQFKSIAELQGFMWLVWETRFRVVAQGQAQWSKAGLVSIGWGHVGG